MIPTFNSKITISRLKEDLDLKISILKLQVCRPTPYKILNVDLSNIYKEMIILFPLMFSRFINSTIAYQQRYINNRVTYPLLTGSHMDSGKRDLEPGFIFQTCMTDEWTLDHTETYLKKKT